MRELKEIFRAIDTMMVGCEIDCNELKSKKIDGKFFEDYQNQRVVNSFLFNFSKIQDKMGTKLFRKVLYVKQEIDSEDIAMKDVLNLLEKLRVIESTYEWERAREMRNILSREHPFDTVERVENLSLAIEGFNPVKTIYLNLKNDCEIQ